MKHLMSTTCAPTFGQAWSLLGAARCSGDGSLVIPSTFVPEEHSSEIGLSVWLISLHTVFYIEHHIEPAQLLPL
jgi:hypothetical protein